VDATPTEVRPSISFQDHADNLIKALKPKKMVSPGGSFGVKHEQMTEKKALKNSKKRQQRNKSRISKGQEAKEWNSNTWWKEYKSSKVEGLETIRMEQGFGVQSEEATFSK